MKQLKNQSLKRSNLSSNPYYESIKKEFKDRTIIPQQSNEELKKMILTEAQKMNKAILENVKEYLESLLEQVSTKENVTVDKDQLQKMIENIKIHLSQCY